MFDDQHAGRVVRIAGPVVGVSNLDRASLYDVVLVGRKGLVGEVIRLLGDISTIQVYEETSGLKIGEPALHTGAPLSVKLGPGLLGSVFDGLQRPLDRIGMAGEVFIERGINVPALLPGKEWDFKAGVRKGEVVSAGDVLGSIRENTTFNHLVIVPAGVYGEVEHISSGKVTNQESICRLVGADGKSLDIGIVQEWPVRNARPIKERLESTEPLITGTRVIDTLFPIAKGGTAIIPGGFGTGKTVILHSLARWSDVDVVIYVGCGERGNEMADVLEEFPELEDPRSGQSLMNRTVLIANTSNMPVAAREASIYTGITIAEYYRDMGYDVLLVADSTSRWGEALREISGRLEEMPGEEGYPAYLGTRLSEFYERAGRIRPLGRAEDLTEERRAGSVTVIGAVSPPGGDFSEPITQNSMRVTGTFWALDYELSRKRHFPSINWIQSYSLYDFNEWFEEHVDESWGDLVQQTRGILQKESSLLEIVRLVGREALSQKDQLLLVSARMLREDFLQQSAYDPVDRYSPLDKTLAMLRVVMQFQHSAQTSLDLGTPLERITAHPLVDEIARMKELPAQEAVERLVDLKQRVEAQSRSLWA